MPLALEPGITFEVVLESDKKKPDPKPTFVFKYLSGREFRQVGKVQEKFQKAKETDAVVDALFEAVAVGLVDWFGMIEPGTGAEIPFKTDDLERILTIPEANELLEKKISQLPSDEDKKKLE